MGRDWYRDQNISPEAAGDEAYREWALGNGLYVDLAGNVDYGPPEDGPARPESDGVGA